MFIGHASIIKNLTCLADAGNLSHGYVFFGPAMIGKRSVARALANYIETGIFEEPKLLQDFLCIEPDEKNTIGINHVRQIKHFLWQKPALSSRRTLVLDNAECMTAEAQNALLKITEEPPASSLLLLVTSDIDSLNPTVFSRLQKIYFSPVSESEILEWAAKIFGDGKKIKSAVVKSIGKPGLLRRILEDEDFAVSLDAAEKISKSSPDKRRDLLKKMMDRDGFDFGKLLDSLILLFSWEFFEKRDFFLWHALLKLRHDAAYFNLNPRLQIESLFSRRGVSSLPDGKVRL
ncbi:MAG: hypothetical protein AAB602_02970 [Patescibacteria group bacterium]